MSDLHNENQPMDQNMEQETRVVPAMDELAVPVTRHRRSDRHRTQEAENVQPAEEQKPEQPAAEASMTRPLQTVTPRQAAQTEKQQGQFAQRKQLERPQQSAAPQQTSRLERPQGQFAQRKPMASSQGVPKPEALRRVEQAAQTGGSEADKPLLRRPVSAPGYTASQPLDQKKLDQKRPDVKQPRTGSRQEMPPRQNRADLLEEVQNSFEDEEMQEQGPRRGLIAAVIVVLVLALIALALLLIPNDADGFLGSIKGRVNGVISGITGKPAAQVTEMPAPVVDSFNAASPTQVHMGAEIIFNTTTNKVATGVRLVDDNGSTMSTRSDMIPNAESVIWVTYLKTSDAYEGMVHLQVANGDEWIDADRAIEILVDATGALLPDELADPDETINLTADAQIDPVTEDEIAEAADFVSAAPALDMEEGEPTAVPELTQVPVPTATVVPTPTLAVSPTPTIPAEDGAMLPDATPAPELEAVPEDLSEETADDLFELPGEAIEELYVDDLDELDDRFDHQADAQYPDEAALTEDWDEIPADEETAATAEPVETAAPVIADAVVSEAAQDSVSAVTALNVAADENASPALITTKVIYDGSKVLNSYVRNQDDIINMPAAGQYSPMSYGVLTFRSDAFRQNAAEGTVGDISTMSVKWKTEAGSAKSSGKTVYHGIGWTGQPAIIKWSKEVREMSGINDEKSSKVLKEVIIAGEDGRIYFLDLDDGEETRPVINLGYPMRGTPSIHPLGFPMVTVGQYARKMASGNGDIGVRVYNLLTQKQDYLLDGLDRRYNRPYYTVGAFDTSALIDSSSDTMVTAGTNGMLYLTKLNTAFSYDRETGAGSIRFSPESIVLKSKVKGEADKNTAVESSIAMYQNYVFYADMEGILRCIDTTTLEVMWAVDTGDAVQAAVSLDLDADGTLWLYTANTLQNRSKGSCQVRRYNAATGAQDWVLELNVTKKKDTIAGFMASPFIGRGSLNGLVYFTASYVSKNGAPALGMSEAADGVLIAVNKADGSVAWTKKLDSYSYSSPVAVYGDDGRGWIIQASNSGTLYLLDGQTGAEVNTLKLDGVINASPAVYKNTLVIGTQGKGTAAIYGITLE